MKKLLTIGLLLAMLSMPSNVNAQRFLERVNQTLERINQTLEQVQEATTTASPNETAVEVETTTTTATTASSGVSTSDGIRVISAGRRIERTNSENITFFNPGDSIRFYWGVPTGGCPGGVSYLWQQSNDGLTWTNAPGANTRRFYITQPITTDTYFRRLATDDCGVTFSTISVRITIDRTIWATRNVDMFGTFAANPQDPGRFYQWNRRTSWTASPGDITGWDNSSARGSIWERNNDPCPPGWRVPTGVEISVLNRHRNHWVRNWNGTGVSGRVFGTEPNQIFLPHIGTRYWRTGALLPGTVGSIWNSGGGRLEFGSAVVALRGNEIVGRASGHSVRCVKEIPYTASQQPVAPPIPESTFNPLDGVVINGVRWATRNVDMPGTFAANPESAGMLFQWNRRQGWAATGNITGWDSTYAGGTEWARANDPCPPGWRVPTNEEFRLLVSYTDSYFEERKLSFFASNSIEVYDGMEELDQETMSSLMQYFISMQRPTTKNGVNGVFVGGARNQIFLPITHPRNQNAELSHPFINDIQGWYWACAENLFIEGFAPFLSVHISVDEHYIGTSVGGAGVGGAAGQAFGLSIRCVAE